MLSMTAATAVAAEVAMFLFPLFLVAAAAGVLDLASFWTEVDLGGMAGEAPRDFRLSEPPRFGLGDAESVTFFDLTNSLLDSLFALGDAE